jgi:hypothetical protein
MFDLISYMENIATTHKSIGHTSTSPKFFRCTGIAQVEELLQNIASAQGTILLADINLGGTIFGETESFTDQPAFVYYVMKQANFHDLEEQATIKKECKELGLAILAKLKHDRWQDNFNAGANGLKALDLSRIPYDTIGPIANHWYGCMFTFRLNVKASESGMIYDPDDYE